MAVSPITYFKQVREELSKVTWPKRKDVVRGTISVIVVSGVVAIILGAFDWLFLKGFEQLFSQLSK